MDTYEKKYKESMAKMSAFLAKHDGFTISKDGEMYKELSEIFDELKESEESEDEKNFNWFEKFFRAESVVAEGKDIPQDRYLWFKNLKYRVQPKQEWSEEDEGFRNLLIAIMKVEHPEGMFEANGITPFCGAVSVHRVIDWLKSLKDRYTWKPSEGQLEALKKACDEHWEPDGLDPLYTLYQDLKKLREE